LRQQGNIRAMIWNISEIIAELSTLYHLLPGDLIFTGTPAGVGPVQRGDLIQGAVEGIATVAFRIG
jgi:fumarylpyruvate hydrolase